MDRTEDRPTPRATAIDPTERVEILRELLTVERARLANALRLEQARSIVFPETTVIIKDIERLVMALATKAADEPTGTAEDRAIDDLLASLAEGEPN
ncbi:MAG: hypothetical protein Q7O66_06800 [Dehalococcoidia bacterium]|nr:hypothetical protein [Dehalococcoidia bacterium]